MLTEQQAARIIHLNAPLLEMLAEYISCRGDIGDWDTAEALTAELQGYISSLVEEH